MERIQFRQKVKGWRKPPGVIDVSRQNGHERGPVGTLNYWGSPYPASVYGKEQAVALYRRDVEALSALDREAWLAPLRQATALMCWCPLDKPCHADVLIEYLNRPAPAREA
jgi:hypothetical protein